MRKLWPKYENWSKLGRQNRVYRYTPNVYPYTPNVYPYTPNVYPYTLAKNDQNLKCTDTCSRCTGTHHRKMPRVCVLVPFFHILILNSTLHFKHTSNPFPIHLGISFLFNSSFNSYHSSKIFHEFPPTQL